MVGRSSRHTIVLALFLSGALLTSGNASTQSCDAECEASIPGGTVPQCWLILEKEDEWSPEAAVDACIAMHDQCLSVCSAPQQAALETSAAPLLHFEGPKTPATVDISWIQSMLNSLGYSAGREDGRYGPQTRGAIEKFERSHGMPVTGVPSVGLQEHIAWTAAPLD